MQVKLEETPQAERVASVVSMLGRLSRGEMLTVVCLENPEELAREVVGQAGDFDRQAVHVGRKKSEPWFLYFKRKHRP